MSTAEQMAQSILTTHWDKTLPINVAKLATSLGIQVEYVDLSDDISGSYKQTNAGGIIHINTNQHPNRQRFTLAHELGHHVLLHGDMVDSDETLFRQDGVSNPLEVDANKFAAELLMPEALVNHLIRSEDKPTIDYLSEKFEVSPRAMIIRLKNLGWL